MCGRQLANLHVGVRIGWFVLHDVTGLHVLEHVVGVPSTLDDEVAVVLEPFDQGLGFLADVVADAFDNGLVFGGGDDLQSFDSHEGYPRMGVFFHSTVVI